MKVTFYYNSKLTSKTLINQKNAFKLQIWGHFLLFLVKNTVKYEIVQFDKADQSVYGKGTREYICKARFLKGSPLESFEYLSLQYQPMIHKIMRSLHIYKNKDEYYQIGLIALWEASNRFDADKGNFTTYAYTFIKGRILIEMGKNIKLEEKMVCPEEDYWEYIEDPCAIHPLEENLLLSYCTNLTENQTKWVMYAFLQNLTINEIAELKQVSPSAVKSWRCGARERLKAQKEVTYID